MNQSLSNEMSAAMLKERFLYELGLLVKLKEKHACIKEYYIKTEDPLTIFIKLFIHEHEYDFNIIFPEYYPFQPMIIYAVTQFNTPHIYSDNSMCLKWGIDNWHEDITVVEMVENLIELISIENPLGTTHGTSESGHEFTLEQNIRHSRGGLLFIDDYMIKEFKRKQGKGTLAYRTHNINNRMGIFFVRTIGTKVFYKLTKEDREFKVETFNYYKLNISSSEYHKDTKSHPIQIKMGFLMMVFNDVVELNYLSRPTEQDVNQLFGSNDTYVHENGIIYTKNDVKEKFHHITQIEVKSFQTEMSNRINLDQEILDKQIMIFGLGSVGSRVLLDLARAGFHRFVLIDEEFFLPGNIVRHELSMRNIGDYKVLALSNKIINEINHKVKIEAIPYSINGQNSSTLVDKVISFINQSDIVIDCTADSNLIFSINQAVMKYDIPYVSGTVISGGIGNILIKREKGSALSIIDILETQKKFMKYNNIEVNSSANYEGRIGDRTYIATMSDVSIIAGLVGKTAISLLTNDPTQKPKSDIYFMSTNNNFLGEFYNCQPIIANQRNYTPKKLDANIVQLGKDYYENHNAKNNQQENISAY